MPRVEIETSTQTPKKGARIPRGNKPDDAWERAKRLAKAGHISPKQLDKMRKR